MQYDMVSFDVCLNCHERIPHGFFCYQCRDAFKVAPCQKEIKRLLTEYLPKTTNLDNYYIFDDYVVIAICDRLFKLEYDRISNDLCMTKRI